jgi:hypothetical protein
MAEWNFSSGGRGRSRIGEYKLSWRCQPCILLIMIQCGEARGLKRMNSETILRKGAKAPYGR